MKSRAAGTIKDILIVAFFFVIFYALTHNSHVRPQPITSQGEWSIELHQKPLALGVAGHNYLVLRNDEGEIISTLHGLPTDEATGDWKYVGKNKKDILKVWEFGAKDDEGMRIGSYGVSLVKTNKEEAISRWVQAQQCGEMIDALSIPYPPFGVSFRKDTENSNSVAYTLASCMNLKTSHVGLFTPGWGKNLLEN